MALRSGDWVEVRSKAEILRSLDNSGRLEKLPFTPQMFEYCGQRFKVYKRAHKTCDTVNTDLQVAGLPTPYISNFVAMVKHTAVARPHAPSFGRRLGSNP